MAYKVLSVFQIISLFLSQNVDCISEQRNIELKAGEETTIQTPGYPTISPKPDTVIIWSVTSPKWTLLTLTCDDVRIAPSEDCRQGHLVVVHSAGKSSHYCGSEHGIEISSIDNYMAVKFALKWSQGVARCNVKATEITGAAAFNNENPINVKKVVLKPDAEPYTEIELKHIPFGETLKWEFTTDLDYKVGITCPTLWFSNNTVCETTNVTINLGENEEMFCETIDNPTFISDENVATLTVNQYSNTSIGFITCTVLATRGPNFEPWLNEDLGWTFNTMGGQGETEDIEGDNGANGITDISGIKQTSCNCGWSNEPRQRVLNGIDAGPHEFPWMAAIKHNDKLICGGTIITERHVVTAAHCTFRIDKEELTVLVGTRNIKKTDRGQLLQIDEIFTHKYIHNYSHKNDIAIILLKVNIEFSQKVGPACLPAYEPYELFKDELIIMGWGATSTEEMVTKITLKKATTKPIRMRLCNIAYDYRFETRPVTQLCTWSDNTDVCFGDGGGPVVWLDQETNRYTLIGIPVVGDGCTLEKPSVHTAVYRYYPWILDIIKKSTQPELKACTKID